MKRLHASEKAIQAAVVAHWRAFGVPGSLVAAIPNARAFGQPGLTKGLFDLLVIAPGLGVCFMELKTARGKVSQEQRDFETLLWNTGVPYAIAYGRDEPIAVLEEWGVVRRKAA